MIRVTDDITLDESELEESFVRSSGPGGQNVNKVSSAVQLRFDVRRSPSLPNDVAIRLMRLAGKRMTKDGVLVIIAQLDIDARGAGIERVLDQLLDASRGPLDHLAGGDAIDQALGQTSDGHALRAPAADGAAISPRYWRTKTLPSSTAG
jgi:ribosome-associated protein